MTTSSPPLRLLMFTAGYHPLVNGVTQAVDHLARNLTARGHQVLIFAPRHPHQPATEPHVYRYFALKNPLVPYYPIGLPVNLDPIIRSFRPHLIHLHHPFLTGLAGHHLAKKYHLPLIFTHHTHYQQYTRLFFPQFLVEPLNLLVRLHLNWLLRQTCVTICPSPQLEKSLQSPHHHLLYLPNSIDTQKFKPTAHFYPHRLVFVGRLSQEKSPEKLVKFLRSLVSLDSRFQLDLIGNGPARPQLQQLTQAHQLTSHLHFKGTQTQAYLQTHLPRYAAFISYSSTEVMPLTFLEAMACGLPILSPHSSLYPFLNSHNSLPLHSSFSAAAHQIQQLLPAAKFNRLRHTSRRQSLQYNHQPITRRLEAVYYQCLKQSLTDL